MSCSSKNCGPADKIADNSNYLPVEKALYTLFPEMKITASQSLISSQLNKLSRPLIFLHPAVHISYDVCHVISYSWTMKSFKQLLHLCQLHAERQGECLSLISSAKRDTQYRYAYVSIFPQQLRIYSYVSKISHFKDKQRESSNY